MVLQCALFLVRQGCVGVHHIKVPRHRRGTQVSGTHLASTPPHICHPPSKGGETVFVRPISATHCTKLQHNAIHCTVLQYTAMHCIVLHHTTPHLPTCRGDVCCNMLQCIAVCCSVLQCVAVCCSVLQHVLGTCVATCCSALHVVGTCVATCCSALHVVGTCVATCCSALQHTTPLQHVAVHCMSSGRVLQHVAVRCNTRPHTCPAGEWPKTLHIVLQGVAVLQCVAA